MNTENWGFCDLSVRKNFDLTKLHEFEKLGFNTIAIDVYVEENNEEPKKKKKRKESKDKQDLIPAPIVIPKDILQSTNLKILHRVTIEFSESSIALKMNQSENLKKFDIIAVVPKSLQAFQYACGSMDTDIISFEPESRIPFKMTRKLYRQAADRGVFFEVMYSPAIRDTTSRKNIISNAHMYHAIGKSKNIILTSGAENYMHLRSVQDVFNLGFILGLNGNESLEVIRNNARKLILKAKGRSCGKLYLTVSSVNSENDIKINEK